MPPTKTVSKLASKMGVKAAAAVQAHANDETTYGFIELPGGIRTGVAELNKCYFKEFESGENKGKFFFRAQATVIDPISFPTPQGVVKTQGAMTSIQIPLCDTKTKTGPNAGKITTEEEHWADVLLEMRRLGGENFTDGATIEDMEALALALEETQPPIRFMFSTSVPATATSRPFHNWHGTKNLPEGYEPPSEDGEAGGMVESGDEDTVGPAEEKVLSAIEKTMSAATPKNGKPVAKTPAKAVKTPEPEPEPEEEPTEDGDEVILDDLVADADSDSETAADSSKELIRLAVEMGIDEKKARKSPSWEALADMIRATRGQKTFDENPDEEVTEETEPEEEEPTGPQEGDEVLFAPTDPKTKKPVKTPIKCTIILVNDDDTVNIKTGKTVYKSIAVSRVQRIED